MVRAVLTSRALPPVLLASIAALTSSGCTGDCVGTSCSDLYPRLDVGFFGATSLREGSPDALSPDARVSTSADDGLDLAVAADERLYVGVPDAAEVRWWTGAEILEGADPSVLTSPVSGDGFGTSVSARDGRLLIGAPEHARSATIAAAGTVYVFDGTTPASLDEAVHLVEGAGADDRLGSRVWACGDLDGDGADDWAAQAPWAGTEPLAGAVVLGLSASLPDDVNLDAASLPTLSGDTADGAFGTTLVCDALIGGTTALIVGGPYADGAAASAEGAVYVWSALTDPPGDPTVTLTGGEAQGYFGTAVATGDLDGDGQPELVVGAPGEDAPGVDGGVGGAVYVYTGTDLATALETGEPPAPARTLRGEFSRGRFGSALAIADVDGDGVQDLFIGAPGTNLDGQLSTTHAGLACGWWGPYTDWPETSFSTDAAVVLAADRQYLEVGRAMVTLDLEGDGASELGLRLRQPSRTSR